MKCTTAVKIVMSRITVTCLSIYQCCQSIWNQHISCLYFRSLSTVRVPVARARTRSWPSARQQRYFSRSSATLGPPLSRPNRPSRALPQQSRSMLLIPKEARRRWAAKEFHSKPLLVAKNLRESVCKLFSRLKKNIFMLWFQMLACPMFESPN